MINALYFASGIVLVVSAVLVLVRLVIGPTVLNRALANDVLVAVIIACLGLEAVVNRHTTTFPILASLALLGFISTVAVARFVARDIDSGATSEDALPEHVMLSDDPKEAR